MTFPFALSRIIILFIIIIASATSLTLSAIAFHEKTGGAFQALAMSFAILTLLSILGCTCHQLANRDEEAGNVRNVGLFGFCGLLGFALAVSLTVHAAQDGGVGLCRDFAKAARPCVLAGVQLGLAYVSFVFGLIGCIIAWIDKLPGAVKVTPRYPITKAPSSHFAAYGHDLDGSYTRPPVKVPTKPRNNSGWSDVPLHC